MHFGCVSLCVYVSLVQYAYTNELISEFHLNELGTSLGWIFFVFSSCDHVQTFLFITNWAWCGFWVQQYLTEFTSKIPCGRRKSERIPVHAIPNSIGRIRIVCFRFLILEFHRGRESLIARSDEIVLGSGLEVFICLLILRVFYENNNCYVNSQDFIRFPMIQIKMSNDSLYHIEVF